MFVRPISFVDYFEVSDVKVEISQNLCLYDVDNDKDIELVVGSWDSGELQSCGEADVENARGKLSIIKYDGLWKKTDIDGVVSCVTAGEIIDKFNVHILVFCSNGILYLYQIKSLKIGNLAGIIGDDSVILKMTHKQLISHNAKMAIVADIGFSNSPSVLVGFSDRIVRLYRWQHSDNEDDLGFLVEQLRWELSSQIGTVSVHCGLDSKVQILASQAGGCYAILLWKSVRTGDSDHLEPYVDYRIVNDEYKDNLNEVRGEIVGSIRRSRSPIRTKSSDGVRKNSIDESKRDQPYIAFCTIDGLLMLLDDNVKMWHIHLGIGEIFGLCKVDITNDVTDEVVVSSWEGVTYIINHHKEIARFTPKHHSQAFVAGRYATSSGSNQTVLVYSTFNNSLMIYYNLNMKQISARSLLQEMNSPLKQKIKNHGVDVNDDVQMRKFVHDVLYKWPLRNNNSEHFEEFYSSDPPVRSPTTKCWNRRSDAFLY